MLAGTVTCKSCKQKHCPRLRCEVFARQQAALVVHAEAAKVVHKTRRGCYADADKRRTYRREWMRKKRAAERAGNL
jgi:hypothetical protein